MQLDFSKINFSFSQKPLLIGGKAMEYYGLRMAGNDIDLVACKNDIERLAKQYSQNLKDLCGDFGVVVAEFEIWKTIRYFDYQSLSQGAIEEENFLVIALDKLLIQKALAMDVEKCHKDLELIVKKTIKDLGVKQSAIKKENKQIIAQLEKHNYLEKRNCS